MNLTDLVLKPDLNDVDWVALADLYNRAYGPHTSAEKIERMFRRCYVTRIAYLDERIVGAGYALSDGEMDATIHGLAVLPELQRLGIGMTIMRSLLEPLSHLSILLTAEPEYQAAYRKLGFKRLTTAMALRFPPEHLE
jgi:ribosomal protein S18 acetylase RimI-like enzyme